VRNADDQLVADRCGRTPTRCRSTRPASDTRWSPGGYFLVGVGCRSASSFMAGLRPTLCLVVCHQVRPSACVKLIAAHRFRSRNIPGESHADPLRACANSTVGSQPRGYATAGTLRLRELGNRHEHPVLARPSPLGRRGPLRENILARCHGSRCRQRSSDPSLLPRCVAEMSLNYDPAVQRPIAIAAMRCRNVP